jgi:ribosomal protein S1
MKDDKHSSLSKLLFQIHPHLISVHYKINDVIEIQQHTHCNAQSKNCKLSSKQLNPEKWNALINKRETVAIIIPTKKCRFVFISLPLKVLFFLMIKQSETIN